MRELRFPPPTAAKSLAKRKRRVITQFLILVVDGDSHRLRSGLPIHSIGLVPHRQTAPTTVTKQSFDSTVHHSISWARVIPDTTKHHDMDSWQIDAPYYQLLRMNCSSDIPYFRNDNGIPTTSTIKNIFMADDYLQCYFIIYCPASKLEYGRKYPKYIVNIVNSIGNWNQRRNGGMNTSVKEAANCYKE